MFHSYEYEGPQAHTLDLANIPKECLTVTVDIRDEKLKAAVERRITDLKRSLKGATEEGQWALAGVIATKLRALEEVLKEAGF
ncbi:hypothetical protein ABZ791_10575 [Streptomyces huasconensis]|uniref:Uncharacterized protein n=1 Tax=Streptomyces huasconensis TaxID=1854574 RepID=A0ABV3M713_9ACTN